MRCPYRYQLIHMEKLVRRWTPAPMKRGTLVHAGLQFALWWDWTDIRAARGVNGESIRPDGDAIAWAEAAISNAQAAWLQSEAIAPHLTDDLRLAAERQVEEARAIFRRVWTFLEVGKKWETVSIVVNGRAVPLIEYKMRAQLEGLDPFFMGVQGTLDWVAKDLETGHLWLFDLKTLKAIQSDEYHFLQIQAPLYMHLLKRDADLDLVGTATLQARAAIPQVPEMNMRKGKGQDAPGMSKSKIATDPQTYLKALVDNGLDPDDYLGVLSELKQFDRISFAYRTPDQVSKIVDTLKVHAHLIAAAHANDTFPRNAYPFGCKGCTHRTYCEADLLGEDTDFLTQTEYMHEGDVPFPVVEIGDDDDSD